MTNSEIPIIPKELVTDLSGKIGEAGEATKAIGTYQESALDESAQVKEMKMSVPGNSSELTVIQGSNEGNMRIEGVAPPEVTKEGIKTVAVKASTVVAESKQDEAQLVGHADITNYDLLGNELGKETVTAKQNPAKVLKLGEKVVSEIADLANEHKAA